jgi:hypothetical protein
MSQEGTKRHRDRSDLLKRLEVLKPTGTDILMLRLPDKYFPEGDAQGPNEIAVEFANAVMRAAKRPVFIVQIGQEDLVYGPPKELLPAPVKPQPPVLDVARTKIIIPAGVRLDGI